MDNGKLSKEDFTESCCCGTSCGKVPTDRILNKLDSYLARDDYGGAERHLLYWIKEATAYGDKHGLLMLQNECIGLYRKTGKGDTSLEYAAAALKSAAELGLSESVTMGTTYINVATAYCACKRYAEALPYYEKAQALYEKLLPNTDGRMGGLYNNMALAVMETGDLTASRLYFNKALAVMEGIEGGEPSRAITLCNLADLAAREKGEADGEKEISSYLENAEALLESVKERRDAEYAYACEKCAPAFGHYGFFVYENELKKRSRSIYEGN